MWFPLLRHLWKHQALFGEKKKKTSDINSYFCELEPWKLTTYKVLSDEKGNKEGFSVKILHHVQSVL